MPVALIVGAGSGLSASLGRLLKKEGFDIAVASRTGGKFLKENFLELKCDATNPGQVEEAFKAVGAKGGVLDLVLFNRGHCTRGAFPELTAEGVKKTRENSANGGLLVRQAALQALIPATP